MALSTATNEFDEMLLKAKALGQAVHSTLGGVGGRMETDDGGSEGDGKGWDEKMGGSPGRTEMDRAAVA